MDVFTYNAWVSPNVCVYIQCLGEPYLPNGNFEKTGQGFSVKTGQNTGQNFRALPWMPSEVPFAKDKSIGTKRDVEKRGVTL